MCCKNSNNNVGWQEKNLNILFVPLELSVLFGRYCRQSLLYSLTTSGKLYLTCQESGLLARFFLTHRTTKPRLWGLASTMTTQKNSATDLPSPFGKEIKSKTELDHCFNLILRDSPIINLYDGKEDYRTEIIDYTPFHKSISVLKLVPFREPIYSFMHKSYLARTQHYEKGLLHRLSFHVKLVKLIKDSLSSVLLAEIMSSIHKVSNLYIMIPREEQPVYLEIPIEGAPPEVRVLEMSLERLKANVPDIKKISLEKKRYKNLKIHLFDLGDIIAEGKIESISKESNTLDISLKHLGNASKDKLNSYINNDFKYDRKTIVDKRKKEDCFTKTSERKDATPTILVADDESNLRSFVAKLLEREGFNVIEAKDGLETIRLIKRKRPNLVLLDISMPDLNGFGAIREIKKYRETRNIPIIILSGHNEREIIEEALTLDIVDFVVKPFRTRELLERVTKTLKKNK